MSNNKMKGLLKGLRYISQMFENEKEAEMQIGYPTDVKHVAHIGLDGQSDVKPAAPRFVSAPLILGERNQATMQTVQAIMQTVLQHETCLMCGKQQDATHPQVPRLRPPKEKPEKTKQSKKSLNVGKSKEPSQSQEGDSPTKRPEIPKKSRRKKSESMEGSSRSSRSRRAHGHKDQTSESELVSRAADHCQNSSEGGEDKGFIGIS
ncbi:LOW QUALITY PROTEIN: CRIB domain-containing protein RIC7-like [Mangifera indica]|uniref:LOW QUALITY PROTEIN: CRIB domain-containing protein RIC7-like n=1 Tax=Mangifera indica TaxID=29780 RepID=UPI001CFB9632|nr:LOW QUALITY PROTEIN: CRIB domain-containing protein RIC7-like [Mangifera indica]